MRAECAGRCVKRSCAISLLRKTSGHQTLNHHAFDLNKYVPGLTHLAFDLNM